jgi:small-conductance mechanosensitive channel
MAYIQNFKNFLKEEEKKEETKVGAQPIREEDALLTDPDIKKFDDQISQLKQQLSAVEKQRDTKVKELRGKAEAASAAAPAVQPQPPAPATA